MQDHRKNGRRYDAQFKADAVTLVQGGKTMTSVANDLGIALPTLKRWLLEVQAGVIAAQPSVPLLSAEQRELRQLRREVEDLREQRDILKKALSVCATGRRHATN
jgi:transposase